MRASSRTLRPRRGFSPRRLRFGAVALALALVAVLAPSTLIPAGAAEPAQVNFTLEGCRNNGDVLLPDTDGDFICEDAAYTTGNLGKGWNELDLVPYRLTADAGTSAAATQTYTLAVVLDRQDAGRPGYDVLSVPVLNDALSDASCTEPVVGAQTNLVPGLGGADISIYRLVTITQVKDSTCVYDYYGRLALGSHLYPGSSLHANLANETLGTSGIGSKEVSIPVREILPQELRKDMTATQGSDHVWNVTKAASKANLTFDETCTDITADLQKPVSITVSWTKLPASPDGAITVVTNIYAENPAARIITVNVSDQIYSGPTAIGSPALSGPVSVPANTEQLVLTHSTSVPAGTTALNDIATATYTDLVTGVPVPGATTATASATVQTSGPEANQTATITDVESITGSGFSFSVDSFSGASGAFDGSYTAGTKTAAPVSWTSASQSGSGSVTFAKTVYATTGLAGNGSLSDTATLTGSDGFIKDAGASVALSAAATVTLTIDKTIPDVLTGEQAASFDFEVLGADQALAATATIGFSAGDAAGSASVSGLAPGTYTVHEVADGSWVAQADKTVTIALPGCDGSVSFANTAKPNGITLDKKVNGADHATAGDALVAHSGDPLTYTVVITNSGLLPLTITTLADTLVAGFAATCSQGIGSVLAPAASFTCTYQLAADGDVTNVAGVTGVDTLERTVKAQDSTFVDVIHPAIQVVKTVDDETPDVGQTVTYTYVVTNTGDTGLSGVTVVDDVLGDIGTVASLAPGASATLTRAMVVTAGSAPRNVATAAGTDVLGKKVTDDDDAAIAVVLGEVLVKPAELPRTGSPAGQFATLGLALLVLGLGLQSARRRRSLA